LNKFVSFLGLTVIDERRQIVYQPTGIKNLTANIMQTNEIEYYYLLHPISDELGDESVNGKSTQQTDSYRTSCGTTNDNCKVLDLNDITSVQNGVDAVIEYIYWLTDTNFTMLFDELSNHNSVKDILYPISYNALVYDQSTNESMESLEIKIRKDNILRVSTRILNVPDVMHSISGSLEDVIINTNIFPLLYAIQLAAMTSRHMGCLKPFYIVEMSDITRLGTLKQIDYATNQYREMYTPQNRNTAASTTAASTTAASTTAASTTPATTTAASGFIEDDFVPDAVTQSNVLTVS
jgi:hypothetical protein